jgi:hypothetical protein
MTALRRRTRNRLALRHALGRRKTTITDRCRTLPTNSRSWRRWVPPRALEVNRDAR